MSTTTNDTTNTLAELPLLLSLREAARMSGVNYWTLREYVLGGRIPVVRLPGRPPREGEPPRATLRRTFIHRDDLRHFVDARRTTLSR